MDRRVPLLVALALLAPLSGCSVMFGDDGAPATPTPAPTAEGEAAAERTPASTPTAPEASAATETATAPPDGEPTGANVPTATPAIDPRSVDAAALNAEHVAALETAGSFATESSLVVRNETATRYINGSYRVERDGPVLNAANITVVVDGAVEDLPTTTRYTDGGRTYERRVERTGDGVEVAYREGAEPYGEDDPRPVNRTVAYTLGEIARAVVDGSAWNRTGRGQFDGVAVTRYDAAGERFGVEGADAAEGSATLVVDEDGVVRYVAYRFAVDAGGERTAYVYEAAYAGVGSTTVSEPDWTDRA